MVYEIKVGQAGFGITEGIIVQWHKSVGQKVQEGETIVSVETDKVVVEIPAQCTGVLIEIKHEVGETVPIGTVLGTISEEGVEGAVAVSKLKEEIGVKQEALAAKSGLEKKEEFLAGGFSTQEKKKISPLARDIARREGIDLSEISVGSGPRGRIVKEDVLNLIEKKKAAPPEIKKAAEKMEEMEKVKFLGWRKVIADRMISSARNVPQASTLMEIDVTEIARLIASSKAGPDQVRLTYLPFIMKAIQLGIHVAPEINAYCYEDGFVLQKDLNIGVAVDLGEKLIVPVVKGVREKSILELAEEVRDLAKKARAEKLEPKDVEGGTITITNLGPFGAYAAVPLILQPQTTIIGIGAVQEEPSVVNGSIEVRKRMMVTGVFDHRVINGASGARFLRELKTHLEDPKGLILRMR
ncbi:MAG: dihydrolipoamide acetyltransferase family protein [Thermodesulfobacteriota bacterium]|jgi:pyruvate dehydrogenase E2 component (dihydrolipoamide acetyltransferase)